MKSSLIYLSPGKVLLLAGALLFGFTLMPPGVYEHYVGEPNYMFGNIILYLFLGGCLLTLWVAIHISTRLPAVRTPRIKRAVSIGPFSYLFWPIACALMLLAVTAWSILHSDTSILGLLLSGQGQEVKRAMVVAGQGAFNGSLPLAMGVSWWALARYLELRRYIRRFRSVFLKVLVGLLVIVLLLTATLMMSRFVVMPTLFGLFIVYLRHKLVYDKANLWLIVRKALWAVAIVIALFWFFASIRNSGDNNAVLQSFVGYGPGAVNHLAALLAGKFNLDVLGGYLQQENFGFFYKFPFVIRLLEMADAFVAATEAMFYETWRAGLNGSYIWITAFGEIGAQLKLGLIIYLCLYGYVVARAWRSFLRGEVFGTVIYPWAAFCIAFSFGSNFFASGFLSVLVLSAFILWIYTGLVNVKQEVRAAAIQSVSQDARR